MNLGEFLDSNSCGGGSARILAADLPYTATSAAINIITSSGASMPIAQPRQLPSKPVFTSPGLSLALQTGMEGQAKTGENYELRNVVRGRVRSREEEEESRSGSEDNCGGSGDDHDGADKPSRKKRYHRHTPQQIQELEALFKECPHPDEKQRLDLSRRLCLETRQVKFWFQNRRTQMKTQLERHENLILRQENDKLRVENMSIREAVRSPVCTNCGSPAIIGDISLEEQQQQLRMENARLKDELDRVCMLVSKFLGRPTPPMPDSSLELGVGSNVMGSVNLTLPLGPAGSQDPDFLTPFPTIHSSTKAVLVERSSYLELALAAMDELVKMAQMDEPLWLRTPEGDHHEEYARRFMSCLGGKPNNAAFVTETSREIGTIVFNSLALVEILMDASKWADMFPCIIARSTTSDVISSGMGGTRNGALQLMHAELQVVSPLVPIREVNFIRFCKQHAEGIWAVVDVSVNVDSMGGTSSGSPVIYPSCRRLPSGCVVQDMPNGYSKVVWVEHAEYDESKIHELYRPLISAGMGFGAHRWIATLQRQSECLANILSSNLPSAITVGGRRSMLNLAQRMTKNFCAGVCASTVYRWNKLRTVNTDENDVVRILTRKSVDDPGEPPGVVLSAATSVWLPAPPQRLFDFLRNEHSRSEWDILSSGGPMQEIAHIVKGHDHRNAVSLLRAHGLNPSQTSMLILLETSTDASGSLVVYAPVDIPAMHLVMNGSDSTNVALLPSGFAILPDGPGPGPHGSLLTVGFQMLVNSLPTARLTVESVDTIDNLIACTVQKIRAAIQSDG